MKLKLVTFSLLYFINFSCEGVVQTKASSNNSTSVDEQEEGPADDPVMITGAFLTCQWHSPEGEKNAKVGCRFQDFKGKKVNFPEYDMNWSLESDTEAKTKLSKANYNDDYWQIIFTIAAAQARNFSMHITHHKKHSTIEFTRKKPLKNLLEGVSKADSELQKCFLDTGESTKSCFEKHSIDIYSWHNAICPGGTLCHWKTDASVSDENTCVSGDTNSLFRFGSELINSKEDTIEAGKLCNAQGLLDKFEINHCNSAYNNLEIKKNVLTFDLETDQTDTCFYPFEPENTHGEMTVHTFNKKYVVYSEAAENGLDGAPYCFFVLIKSSKCFGSGDCGARLHIIMNPNAYGDKASNKTTLTLEALEKTAENMKCK